MKPYKKPYHIRRKRSVFQNRHLGKISLVLAGVSGFLYLILFAPVFQIKSVQIDGNKIIPTQELNDVIEKNITHKIILFGSKSIFLADIGGMEQIISQYPLILDYKIKRRLPDGLSLSINERMQEGTWCFKDLQCFQLDSNGIIFRNAEDGSSNYFIIRDSVRNELPVLGEKVIESKVLESIESINGNLKENKISSTEFLVLENGRINAKTDEGWDIFFTLKDDISSQLAYLKTVLEQGIPQQEKGKLEYIDLRFGNRIYYK